MINPILFLSIAVFLNLLGGLLVWKLKDNIKYFFLISAVAIIGVASLDLIPEAFEIASEAGRANPTYLIVAGFVLYFIISMIPSIGHKHKHDEPKSVHSDFKVGSIILHSIVDGVAIGAALSGSLGLGIAILTASLIHRFNDGMSIVSIIYGEERDIKKAMKYLIIDCIAPIVGVIISIVFMLEESDLGHIIALLAGAFLYIGVFELLPAAISKFKYKQSIR